MIRTKPEWPTGQEKEIVWRFEGPVTLYGFNIYYEAVTDRLSKTGVHLRFGPYAQNKRSVCVSTDKGIMNWTWPEWAWMVLVRGLHPLGRTETIDRMEMGTIEEFEAWLVSERLEILVDFRASSIAEGCCPPYGGAMSGHKDGLEGRCSLPPHHLAHWYPERTVQYCSPRREEWTERQLNYYIDHDCSQFPLETKPSALLGVEKLWYLIDGLEFEYRNLGRKLKQAKMEFPHLFQRKDETRSQWIKRYLELSREDKERAETSIPHQRQELFQAIKNLKADHIPQHGNEGGFLEAIKPLKKLQDDAVETWRQRNRAKAAIDFPVDDAAWEIELESRRQKELERQIELAKWAE